MVNWIAAVRAGAVPVFLYIKDFNEYVIGNQERFEMLLSVMMGVAKPYY